MTFRAALFGWDGLGTLNREAETVCLGTAPCVIAKTGRKGVRLKVGTYYSISACLPYEVPILGPRGTEISFAVYGRCGLGAIYLSNSGERSWVIGLRPGGS